MIFDDDDDDDGDDDVSNNTWTVTCAGTPVRAWTRWSSQRPSPT